MQTTLTILSAVERLRSVFNGARMGWFTRLAVVLLDVLRAHEK